MTSSNQVSVSQVSDVTTVEITTQGPQGASSTSGISNIVEDTSPQLGGNLDINGQDIVTTSNGNVELDPNGSGVVIFKGNSTKGAGQFKLNCEQNSHGITIKGPPHSAAASYTLTLPNDDGTSGQYLQTDGSGVTSWASVSSGGISNLVEDTTPQLGGNLDMQANNITGTGTVIAASTAIATAGFRKIHASTSAPTGSDGAVGDIWVKY